MKEISTAHGNFKPLLWAIIISFVFPLILPAQEFLPPELSNISGPINITADDVVYWKQEDRYLAKGHVILETDRFKLTCDEAEVDNSTGDYEARGNVQLIGEQGNLQCESLKFNSKNHTGTILKANLYVSENHTTVSAGKIEQIGPGTYLIENASYSTCLCPPGKKPDWSIGAKHLTVKQEGYARTKGASFRIKDTPIFYMPAVAFPVKQERSSGFLIPEMGYSSRNGFEFALPFYVAASRWMDFTLTERLMTERGIKQELEMRWVRRLEREGQLQAFYLDDWKADANRWAEIYTGRVPMFAGIESRQDLRWISDNEYVRDFRDDDIVEPRARFLESRMIFERPFNWGEITLFFRALNDLQGDDVGTQFGFHDNDGSQPNQVPRLGLSTTLVPITHTPLWIGVRSAFDNFYREEPDKASPYKNENWIQRANVYPYVTSTFIPYPGVYIVPEAGVRETAWAGDNDEYARSLAVGKLETGLRMYRIYSERFKHTIEPRVRYNLTRDLGSDMPPPLDFTDKLRNDETIEFNLDQHFLMRRPDEYGTVRGFDTVHFELTQIYFPEDNAFRTLRGQLAIRASDNVRVDSDAKYNEIRGSLNYLFAALTFQDNRGDKINASYRYQSENQWQFLNDRLELRLTPAVAITYFNYVNLTLGKFVDHGGGMVLTPTSECWSLRTEVSYHTDPNEIRYRLFLNLTGLGSTGNK